MPLRIIVPRACAELRWIISVIFDNYLGLAYRLEAGAARNFHIHGDRGHIELPDVFFASCDAQWMRRGSLPATPLAVFNAREAGLPGDAAPIPVPVIYGASHKRSHVEDDGAFLPIDIFGSAFFMLSRYEEAVGAELDRHGRFPAAASLAYRSGFLDRPIIDEYVEILWSRIEAICPAARRKIRTFRNVVTCDVDHPYHASARSVPRLIKRTVGEIVRKGPCSAAFKPVRNYFASHIGNWANDPYYHTIDWMMDVNEQAGNQVAFYFIPEITDPCMDGNCPIADPAVRAMMRGIDARGHEIGIHPGYNSYQSEAAIVGAKRALEHALAREGVRQKVIGGRQHYLRWSTHTPALWDAAGLAYDSTLGYADYAGFRCGTCHSYPMYDLHQRKPLDIRQRPLICMESTLMQAIDPPPAQTVLARMLKLKDAVKTFNGDFMLLWHNSNFETDDARAMYREIIR